MKHWTTSWMLLIAASALGCARWSGGSLPEYVTIDPDSTTDSAAAQKKYKSARKEMMKFQCGQTCDLAKAEQRLKEALAADVRFGPAHHSLGVLYFWQKKLYLAAWEFEYAARLMPDRFEPLNNLGLVYESADKLDQAKMFYEQALDKARKNPEVIGNLARVSYRRDEPINEIRPLLDDVLATDTRPEWRRWARDLKGLNPIETASLELPADIERLPPTSNEPTQTDEELPLIPAPAPMEELPSPFSDQSTRDGRTSGSDSLGSGIPFILDPFPPSAQSKSSTDNTSTK